LKAEKDLIDVGNYIGHSGPITMDFNGDGLSDLLVGSLPGIIHKFQNIGSNEAPIYKKSGRLTIKGGKTAIRIHNW
jgi:hypothetical protein